MANQITGPVPEPLGTDSTNSCLAMPEAGGISPEIKIKCMKKVIARLRRLLKDISGADFPVESWMEVSNENQENV